MCWQKELFNEKNPSRVIWNISSGLHGRAEFRDSDEQKRKLRCKCDKGWVNIRSVPESRENQLLIQSKEMYKSERQIERRNSIWVTEHEKTAGRGKCPRLDHGRPAWRESYEVGAGDRKIGYVNSYCWNWTSNDSTCAPAGLVILQFWAWEEAGLQRDFPFPVLRVWVARGHAARSWHAGGFGTYCVLGIIFQAEVNTGGGGHSLPLSSRWYNWEGKLFAKNSFHITKLETYFFKLIL